jgi:hypothetical protein
MVRRIDAPLRRSTLVRRALCIGLLILVAATAASHAAQVTIQGPPGSERFGTQVTALPNGNFVVTDPHGPSLDVGTVYLYSSDGNLISSLTGSHDSDAVGFGGVVVVGDSNFVVISSEWRREQNNYAGAVTWVSGTTGLSGVISSTNSLVGTNIDDRVGSGGVIVLANGNYVVVSPAWSDGTSDQVGAVTWGDGNSGVSGVVSGKNSLVGSTVSDRVGNGGITVLTNGNYVVSNLDWHNGSTMLAGAVTWGDGNAGVTGAVSANNSLVGTSPEDNVGNGGITALSNGNYVVQSPEWGSAGGAVTWQSGSAPMPGPVDAANSLTGDGVGGKVTALRNGDYVVASPGWSDGSLRGVGAVTRMDGTSKSTGVVSSDNSITGMNAFDEVGAGGVVELANGNLVVVSQYWGNSFGAVTWIARGAGTSGVVSSSNSIVGESNQDQVGLGGVTALTNGNYVIVSPNWVNGTNGHVGAVTWASGDGSSSGVVSSINSLVGTNDGDAVGDSGVIPLSNGNYVVASCYWSNGVLTGTGAVTWGNGVTGIVGTVAFDNSLVGSSAMDRIGCVKPTALPNGNYLVTSPYWTNGAANEAGAMTWARGTQGATGQLSSTNSLVGTHGMDHVGDGGTFAFDDNKYVVISNQWANGATFYAGAATFGDGRFRLSGPPQEWNSVLGNVSNGGSTSYSYDEPRSRWLVGQGGENLVTIFTLDQIFADGLDE